MSAGFHLAGSPWWLVLPAAIGLAWLAGTILRRETEGLPPLRAGAIIWLRRTALILATLIFLEPVYTRVAVRSELPSVAVLIDHSGSMGLDDRSMHPTLRLDQAEALGFLDPAQRPDAGRTIARALQGVAEDIPDVTRALGATLGRDQELAIRERIARHRGDLAGRRPAALVELHGDIAAIDDLLAEAIAVIDRPVTADERRRLADRLASAASSIRDLIRRAEDAQGASDTALVAGAEAGSPIAKALGRSAGMTRVERSRALVEAHLVPGLAGKARIEWFSFGGDRGDPSILVPLAPGSDLRPAGPTDLAGPFSWLSRNWSARHLGAVLLFSDGRQTTGADAVPVVRGLAARGAPVHGVQIGDPTPPYDAAIAGISGPVEIFRGENIHLDVRWRVSGFIARAWDVVVHCAGREVGRRLVRGDGTWQVARFEIAAGDLPDVGGAPLTFTARIEPSRELSTERAIRAGAGLSREVWLGVGGSRLGDFFLSGIAPRRADERDVIAGGEVEDKRANIATRLRGWIVPPESGEYTFWISGDDETEFWLGASGTPYDRVRLAGVPDWTHRAEWDRYTAQRSAPVTLAVGKPVYVEILHKQGSGAAHVALGWQLPSNRLERPIPVGALAPWSDEVLGGDETDFDRPEASLANNRGEIAVMVNEDPLRVLIVDHQPRWDLRYVVALFERDRRIEVVRRYRSIRLPRGEQELIPSQQAEMDAFDVVILGDLAPGELSADDQRRLSSFVSRRGGFLVCVGGPRGMPWGYSLGDLAEVLPIRAGTAPDGRRSLRLALAPHADDHPVTRILDDLKLNRQLWSALEPVQWAATSVTVKPGVQVLLTTADAAAAPIVAVGRLGAGRTAWIGTDETWRWRDRLGDRVHQAFWSQLMRWGLGARLRGADRRLQVALDRPLIEPSQAVDLRARAILADGSQAGNLSAEIVRVDGDGNPIAGTSIRSAFQPVPDTDSWNQRLTDLEEGRWRITVTSDHPDLVGISERRELLVHGRPDSEGVDLGADPAGLQRIAQAGGGIAIDARGFAGLVAGLADRLEARDVERRSTTSLWQTHLALILIVGCLVVEWIVRKRAGLP